MRLAVLALSVLLSGCFLVTDAATRLAGELGDRAAELRGSAAEQLEFSHLPDGVPDGVTGAYEIRLKASGALLVADLGSTNHKKYGYNWSTTSHRRHVGVPVALTISKPAGEPTTFVLRKSGDAIDVVELR